MLVSCSQCGARYTLSNDELGGLSDGVFRCGECGRLIKIAVCPECGTSYSLTYTWPRRESYSFQCRNCPHSFEVLFKSVSGEPRTPDGLMEEPPGKTGFVPPRAERVSRVEELERTGEQAPPHGETQEKKGEEPRQTEKVPDAGQSAFELRDLLASCALAFTPAKLLIAALCVCSILAVFGLSGALLDPEPWGGGRGAGLRSLLGLIAPALSFSLYVLAASVIVGLAHADKDAQGRSRFGEAFSLLSRQTPAAFLGSLMLPLAVAIPLIAFGAIPYVGPVLFALLFFPVYLLAAASFLIAAVGFWFLPPIIAEKPQAVNALRELFAFIRRHNFSLVLVVPVLAVGSAVMASALWAVLAGSLALFIHLSKNILPDGGAGVFSSIPALFSAFFTLLPGGIDPGVFKDPSAADGPEYLIGGALAGIVISILFLALSSSMVSLCATLSARLHSLMQRGGRVDERPLLRVLAVLLLLLIVVLAAKRAFLR